MNVFKKIIKIGQAEIHAFVERMEEPVSMMEQGLQDLKKELALSTEAYANMKGLVIRSVNVIREKSEESEAYEGKALLALQKAEAGELDTDKAERLAVEALKIKRGIDEELQSLHEQLTEYRQSELAMEENVDVIKYNIVKWEKELVTLKAKHRAAETSETVNRHIMSMDSNSTIELLERMKRKVQEEDANSSAFEMLSNSKVKLDKTFEDLEAENPLKEKLQRLKEKVNKK